MLAWAYAALFLGVVLVGYVPPFHDQQGRLFGLFSLQIYDDALHLASGIWAAIAAWMSYNASRTYFRIFGPLYFFDGVFGLFTGMGYLDLGIFIHGPMALPLETRILANLPHLIIGGVAICAGYLLARKPAADTTAVA
jgi:hypothetical protein